MSKKGLYLLGILLTILIGTFLYWKYCCSCKIHDKNPVAIANGYNNAFNLNGNGFNYQCSDNFKFRLNGFDALLPVSDSINQGIQMLKTQFEKTPAQKLTITGFCTPNEPNGSAFPNLGYARANAVKNYLVSQGVTPAKIDILGEIRDSLQMKGDTVFGPLSFMVSELNTGTDTLAPAGDLSAFKEKYNANPLVLYFSTNQTELTLAETERQTVLDLVKYLDKVPDAKLSITGHTDNSGNREMNVKIGKDRADFAKAYFVKNGISEAKLESSSKGPDEPIADNSTAEGKAKNRRTVITIK